VTRGGKPYGWSDLLDKLIIPGTGGETIEGRDRQSVGYGLFGWADLVLIADLAKHAGFKTNLFTYRTPSGNSLLSVGPFYGPIVGGTRADPYPEPESLGGGGYAAVLSKYRAVFETIHVNCTAGALCAPFGAALHAVSPATRGDDYDPHLLGWNALLGVN
ncbi:MAG TPA: hypothetical protein VLN26_06805, partial [Gaiellaceae bacterium]|nr:hypothetical protein [Gaiellaceae bacterium]